MNGFRRSRSSNRRPRVVMLLENDLYPDDVRVRLEALSLLDGGYDVRVVAPRGPGQSARERLEGIEVVRFRLSLGHAGRARDLVREYAVAHAQLWTRGAIAAARFADVLHVHNPPDTLFPPALLGRHRGCRLVFDQHDLFPTLFEEKFGPTRLLAMANFAQRASVRLADLVIATNESQREAAIAAGARQEKVIVVRNALPRAAYARARPLRRGSLTDPHLVYVGAMGAQDGVRQLADVLRGVVTDHGLTGTRMTVIGYGEEREPLERRVAELGLADRVTFTGRLPHDDVLDLIAQADICLDTAHCSELNHRTTMVKIVEYLALGRPTVAFALRETQRTARGAVATVPCGRLDEFIAAVVDLAASEERRDDYGTLARGRAQALTWESSSASLLAGYARIIS